MSTNLTRTTLATSSSSFESKLSSPIPPIIQPSPQLVGGPHAAVMRRVVRVGEVGVVGLHQKVGGLAVPRGLHVEGHVVLSHLHGEACGKLWLLEPLIPATHR